MYFKLFKSMNVHIFGCLFDVVSILAVLILITETHVNPKPIKLDLKKPRFNLKNRFSPLKPKPNKTTRLGFLNLVFQPPESTRLSENMSQCRSLCKTFIKLDCHVRYKMVHIITYNAQCCSM